MAETNYSGPYLIVGGPNDGSYSVLNETAVLTISPDGKTSKLTIKPGFLPLREMNEVKR